MADTATPRERCIPPNAPSAEKKPKCRLGRHLTDPYIAETAINLTIAAEADIDFVRPLSKDGGLRLALPIVRGLSFLSIFDRAVARFNAYVLPAFGAFWQGGEDGLSFCRIKIMDARYSSLEFITIPFFMHKHRQQ